MYFLLQMVRWPGWCCGSRRVSVTGTTSCRSRSVWHKCDTSVTSYYVDVSGEGGEGPGDAEHGAVLGQEGRGGGRPAGAQHRGVAGIDIYTRISTRISTDISTVLQYLHCVGGKARPLGRGEASQCGQRGQTPAPLPAQALQAAVWVDTLDTTE